jgi:hypothetical protein
VSIDLLADIEAANLIAGAVGRLARVLFGSLHGAIDLCPELSAGLPSRWRDWSVIRR